MRKNKIIKGGFTWLPLDKRESRFGGGPMTPRKPETRNPIFWLARDGKELYLVNNSKETLEFVIANTGGFETTDDDVMTVTSEEQYKYVNVNPGDAVKVEEFDDFYDLDFSLQVYLKIKSPRLGCIKIASPPKKGGVGETVLLWDTGETGKYVSINKCTEV